MDKNQWHVGKPGFRFIYGPNGEQIAEIDATFRDGTEAKEIAAQIVREHNAHDELVAALSGLLREVDAAGLGSARDFSWPVVTAAARAALAKAGAL